MITREQRNRYGLPKETDTPIYFVEPIKREQVYKVTDIKQSQKYSKGYSLLLRLENGQDQPCHSLYLKEMQKWKQVLEIINQL